MHIQRFTVRSGRFVSLAALCLSFGCGSDSRTGNGTTLDPASEPGASGGADGGSGNAGASAGESSAGESSAGESSAGAGSAGENCEEHVVAATLATPDMLVVLDRSGSMNPDGNDDGADRWGGSRDAVMQVTTDFDDRVRFGLMTFPGFQGGGGGGGNTTQQCAPGTVNVPIELDQGPEITDALEDMNAGGRTPTASTLQAALTVIGPTTINPDATAIGQKYVLLVTDGDPNCSGMAGGGGNQVDLVARQQTIDAIAAMTTQGIKTYVIGYQTAGSDFESQLDAMAAAGGTGDTQHRSVTSGTDLTATFSQIAAGVISCSYTLDAPVKDPSYVLVTVDSKQRALNNAADGWTLSADKKTVTLTGAACAAVQAGAVFAVEVKCSPVPVI